MERSDKNISEKTPSPYIVGLLCRCPRCGSGKLFEGFLTLKSKCDVCGLDFGFADAGDAPAIFVIMIAGAIVVGAALVTEVKYRPPYWVHSGAVDPVDPDSHVMALARLEKSFDRVAVSSQGIAGKGRSASRKISRLAKSCIDRRQLPRSKPYMLGRTLVHV
jgi:uncharacterized protein (DUF983 family)